MNMTIKGYSPEGFEVSLNRDVRDLAEALAFSAAAAKQGITAAPPDGESHKEETIVTVVRREHVDDKGIITPVVDFYPAWKGDYGQFRFVGVYLNTDEDIAQFEAQSGLTLDSLPLYESQAPLQRNKNRAARCEVKCKPFIAHKQVTGEKMIDDVMQKVWKFSGYGAIHAPTASEPAARPTLPPPGQVRAAAAPAPTVNQGAPLRNR